MGNTQTMTPRAEERSARTAAPTAAAPTPGTSKFSVRNLDFYYGRHHALKSVSVDLYANEITALIGPSGCGKSTFLRTLNRMNELLSQTRATGSVLLDGVDIYDRRVDVVELRKQVG